MLVHALTLPLRVSLHSQRVPCRCGLVFDQLRPSVPHGSVWTPDVPRGDSYGWVHICPSPDWLLFVTLWCVPVFVFPSFSRFCGLIGHFTWFHFVSFLNLLLILLFFSFFLCYPSVCDMHSQRVQVSRPIALPLPGAGVWASYQHDLVPPAVPSSTALPREHGRVGPISTHKSIN